MTYDKARVLRDIIYATGRWVQVRRGRDVARYAAEDLQRLLHVDAGFFLYRQKGLLPDRVEGQVVAYAPWGVDGSTDNIGTLLQTTPPATLDELGNHGRWLSLNELPEPWAAFWANHGIKQVGTWPMISMGKPLGALVCGRTTPLMADDYDVVGTVAIQVAMVLDLVIARRVAQELSSRDFLTGVLNRRGVSEYVSGLIDHGGNQSETRLVGVLDANEFKRINDVHGHLVGDNILKEIGQTLQRFVHGDEAVGRWGGDEFVMLLNRPGANESELESQVRALFTEASSRFSVSVGFARWPQGETWESAFMRADERLYRQKVKLV